MPLNCNFSQMRSLKYENYNWLEFMRIYIERKKNTKNRSLNRTSKKCHFDSLRLLKLIFQITSPHPQALAVDVDFPKLCESRAQVQMLELIY